MWLYVSPGQDKGAVFHWATVRVEWDGPTKGEKLTFTLETASMKRHYAMHGEL